MIGEKWRSMLAERGIKVHPAAAKFPLLAEIAPDELQELADDIKQNGMQQPLVLWTPTPAGRAAKEKFLLDGRNRLDALELAFGNDPELFAEKVEDALYIDAHNGARLLYDNDEDPCDFVISANAHRRHLTREKKRELVEGLLRERPERSDRETARIAKVDHKTVAVVRAGGEASGEIPHVSTRTDTAGRQQPATKPPKPPQISKYDQARAQREATAAAANATPGAASAARLRSVAFSVHYQISQAKSIDLDAARRELGADDLEDLRAKVRRCLGWLRKVEAALGGG